MKTKLIALTLTAVLAAALVSLTACGSSDTASVAESATSETASAATSDITSAIGETATDTESVEETTAQAATEQPVAQPEKPVQTSTGTAAQQPQTTAPATPAPQNHAPIYRQQWVVDKAAWTEELPVYSTVEWAMCTTCGEDITGNTSSHIKEHALKGEAKGGWKSEFKQVKTGTNTIYHEEEGHYEQILVCGGCTSSH